MNDLVTIPLSDKLITNFLEDQTITYNIDYAKSSLQGKKFINYVYNVQINVNIAIDSNLSYEAKSELLLAWLDFRDILQLDTLTFSLMNILLIEKDSHMRYNSIFSEDESKRFIKENRKIIDKIIEFMDSVILFLLHKFDDREIETFKVEKIDDINYVPKNIATLFTINDFYVYYSMPFRKQSWFIRQFEDKRDPLIGYFLLSENNIILGLINAIVKNKITPERFCEFLNA